MYEVELKVPVDAETTRSRLRDRGAERIKTLQQVDTYYDAPDREFAETDEALRIRVERPVSGDDVNQEENGRLEEKSVRTDQDREEDDPNGTDPDETARLTYKGPLIDSSSKTREEHETVVDDKRETAAIFERLGYTPAATVEKDREYYALEGYTLTLDRVADVGEFLEIECEVSAENDVQSAREGAEEVLGTLGLEPDDQIRTSYLGLLLAAEEPRDQ